ncbi:MAG: helix-turn-helix domain-containing protein [Ilumatobacteraceae bacterium]|nr:helix-turn-helix domain-containing protein [Ilumatobacter sp.]MCO5328562.1 helix-turn-helix domain-containing protein [Ilumatobacteraceae bacterium]
MLSNQSRRDAGQRETGWQADPALAARAAAHAALGEPARLAIVEELVVSDRAPKELGERLQLPSNLLAHHLEVLEQAGLILRAPSAGDGRRKYVHLARRTAASLGVTSRSSVGEMLFLCTHNSARSQLAAALWAARTGCRARSAGTRPAARVHRGAVAAARRAGLSLAGASPAALGDVPPGVQVVTVCDLVHEELEVAPTWWHWSIPDPVTDGDAATFDAVVAELDERIAAVRGSTEQGGTR